jgi:BolA family transcriptional regulator, general stress-responsive regulator
MSMREVMENKLRAAFSPVELTVVDESHRHAGHSGARPGGETHFAVFIVSTAFAGQSRVAIHRAINDVLKNEFAAGVHALAISAKSP